MTNKNFIVKHGIEVDGNLFIANPDTNKVGIKTSTPTVELDVTGDVRANNLALSQNLSFTNTSKISIGGSIGEPGTYLARTSNGVAWSAVPGMRTLLSVIASPNQSLFNVVYNISSGIDFFLNGARLSSYDYTANDGETVVLNVPCFGGERVEIIAYTVFGTADVRLSRTIVQYTTAILAANASEDFTISGGQVFKLLSLTSNYPSWSRFYGTSAARTADWRIAPGGTPPAAGTEFYSELATTINDQTIRLSPVPTIQTTNGSAFVRLQNRDSVSRAITLTLSILILED